jgi:hypothetical protein
MGRQVRGNHHAAIGAGDWLLHHQDRNLAEPYDALRRRASKRFARGVAMNAENNQIR